jgi:hypothetical protein
MTERPTKRACMHACGARMLLARALSLSLSLFLSHAHARHRCNRPSLLRSWGEQVARTLIFCTNLRLSRPTLPSRSIVRAPRLRQPPQNHHRRQSFRWLRFSSPVLFSTLEPSLPCAAPHQSHLLPSTAQLYRPQRATPHSMRPHRQKPPAQQSMLPSQWNRSLRRFVRLGPRLG